MSYYLAIFSENTYQAFLKSDKTIMGFPVNKFKLAEKIKPGDKFICYITKIGRWCAVFDVESQLFEDQTPVFVQQFPDPYCIRFKISPRILLPIDKSVPIKLDKIWNALSFTKNLEKISVKWGPYVRRGLTEYSDEDGELIENILYEHSNSEDTYPIEFYGIPVDSSVQVKISENKEVPVIIPENENDEPEKSCSQNESAKVQAKLAEIGERMGFAIWIPKSDRQRISEYWEPKHHNILLEQLPFNYDDATMKTIRNIDVLWVKRRFIVRAFEVEHTTSIYSGILRMADLMALQPNLNIKAHIIASEERRSKVLFEIGRPVFALLEKGPLSESCTYISYESIEDISKERHLSSMNDTILDDYSEYVTEE